MNFETFLKESKSKSFWNKKELLCFVGKMYPLLFFTKLFEFIVKEQVCDKPINVAWQEKDRVELYSLLQQSFLGERSILFLGELLYKKEDSFFKDVISYNGDNKLIFFVNDEISLKGLDKEHIVILDDIINPKLFTRLLTFFNKENLVKKTVLIDNIFSRSQSLSLEAACRIFDYLELVNVQSAAKFKQYIALLIYPDKSFFTLSNYFFSRNKQFFKLWEELADDFGPLFWISYWSEQIWKAHHVCKYMKQNNIVQAKKMSLGLPFSFTKGYWQDFSQQELINEYSFLYRSDCALKLGSTFPLLDLFYSKHFQKEFIA